MADSGGLARLARLKMEIETDLRALDARARDIADLMARELGDAGRAKEQLIVLAAHLHGYYTALETLLERVARLLDESVPAGPAWHVDLLSQMQVELPKLRPAVIPSELAPDLQELRRFRHFFRNAYVLELDPRRTREHGARVQRVHPLLLASLRGLIAHLDAVIRELTL